MTAPKNKKVRLSLLTAAAIALLVLGFAAKRMLFPDNAPRILTAVAAAGDIEQAVLATGTLKPVKLVAVGSQASGRVVSLKVLLGQVVTKGQLIAQIDSVPQENALRTAQASLADSRAQRVGKQATLALAESTLVRQRQNLADRTVSQADFESADEAVKTLRAQIASLEAQIIEAEVAVKTAEANLGYTQITAPTDGTVLSIVTQEGQTVNAVQSAPTIVVLGQLDVMTVRAEISEADIVDVKPGQPVYFTIVGDPGRRYEASLESIEPAPESVKNDNSFSASTATTSSTSSSSSAIYYNGIFNVPNPEGRLRTYMTAEVHIVLGQSKGVLTVPSAALTKGSDGRYTVQVVDERGRMTSRAVEVGLNNRASAEIRSGLQAGERVVVGEMAADSQGSASNAGPPMGL
ncbi:efflux RND transporter periplasmic adaptor subunit [Nevskia soli]|uniref:efflux RND transporter periplasmic adaptor subunit n=1 Tax=Nevskia soli TaxID=418856 RepID=UPI0004A7611E|nr:efflux RND transporter periplasmic adaptor subunit [Nevskia soli]